MSIIDELKAIGFEPVENCVIHGEELVDIIS